MKMQSVRAAMLLLFSHLLCNQFLYSQARPWFSWDSTKGKLPVTHYNFNDDTSLVQFAILSDNAGGTVPGIFADAVAKTNLLQPQFIMSVGDLINGYSTDKELIDAQWKEFQSIVEPLQSPFFYVAGNHDISNSWMQQDWLNRLGQAHYYFVYKNVLFLSVNSQDDGDYGMKQEQVDYFTKVIEQHPNVRWTFVFMHQPLWAKNNTGFEKIEAALQNRNYTVFAAHTHNYLFTKRNNQKYFILATTGGGSARRGEQYGEFDHITWVTLRDKEPTIAHLKLEAIVKEDIVDAEIKKLIRPLTSGNWLKVSASQLASPGDKSTQTQLVFKNTNDIPLSVKGILKGTEQVEILPADVDITVPANSEKRFPITLQYKGAVPDWSQVTPVQIELTGGYMIRNKPYALAATERWLFDWPHSIARVSAPLKTADLSTEGAIHLAYPEDVDEGWDWHGPEDCDIRFKVAKDKQFLYVSAIVKDDNFILQPGENRDKLHFFFEGPDRKPAKLLVMPDKDKTNWQLSYLDGTKFSSKISCTGHIIANEWQALIKIPLKDIGVKDGTSRFNIAYDDQDDPNSLEYSTLYWKPNWKSGSNYEHSGWFRH